GDPHELMRFADIAMYQAKRLGKDRYEVYNPAMNAWAEARLNLELDLRKALERGEFRLVYQPIWSLNAKRVTGLEALIRWHHPKRGSVSPADFIPLAEENGLIIPIGRWVLDEVCRQLAQWQERYPGAQLPAMSVNLSLRQFQDPALAGEFEEIVRRHGLKPGAIQLEITESTLMLDQAATLRTLKRLSDVGFYLALDDFGTGYSAWAHLKGFPFNCIKIDRSFMHGLGQDEESAAIVAAMIDLARALGLEVVAEGIETELQLDVLRALGCGKGQGYLLSRPLPVTETEALVAAGAGPLVDEERS
ncbi:MAG TPA: GGDEF domain-containing phosphodiesterase, partial [Symbiobacteriaceae bacterium]|nr:GGDEF domain-containing phosphodiesterase [Symbiobacteriaceae bacterium]